MNSRHNIEIARRRTPRLRAAALAAALCAPFLPMACIERTNPFDPINLQPPSIQETRDRLKRSLDLLVDAGILAASRLAVYQAAFQADSVANATRRGVNATRLTANDSIVEANLAVADANLGQADADLLQLQTLLQELEVLRAYGPYAPLEDDFDSLKTKALAATRLMETANRDATPVVIYPQAFQDSVLAPLVRDSAIFASILAAVGGGNSEVGRANDTIVAYNEAIRRANLKIRDFNGQVAFQKEAKLKGVVIHSDSLAKIAARTGPGDTLLLGPTEFRLDFRVGSGSEDKPILVRGYPGRKSIILPEIRQGQPINQALLLDTNKHVVFEDLVFRGGNVSGVKLGQGTRNVIFRRCLFEDNRVWGIDASGSDLLLFDCEVRRNGNDSDPSSGGIRVEMSTDSSGRLQLENVLIAENRGHGIEAVSPIGTIFRATLANNTRDGLRLSAPDRNLQVTQSILALNKQFGLWRNPSPINPEGLVVRSCAFSQNDSGDWHLRTLSAERQEELKKENFYMDSVFADPAASDYRPRPGSDLANLETHPTTPVVVGYRPRP